MNCARTHFFTGPGIADQQNRGVTAGDPWNFPDCGHESWCFADEALHAQLRYELQLAGLHSVFFFAESLREPMNSQPHVVQRQRWQEKIVDHMEE